MVGFIVTGHGEFAPGLGSAIQMVAGDQPNFKLVPFGEAEAATFGDTLAAAMADMRAACDGGIVVFVDLLGGTPFNQAYMASANVPDVQIVTGTNLPMLIECLMMRNDSSTAKDIAELAEGIGKSGIVVKALEETASEPVEDESEEDGI